MLDTLDLDKDELIPQSKSVKVGGNVYEVKPLKLQDFLSIQRILKDSKNKTGEEMVEIMGDIFDSMRSVVPDIDKMDLTIQQAMALLEFVYKQEQLNQAQTTEKKTEVQP